MTAEQMLAALKIDLGLTTTIYDERLSQYLRTARSEIEREGVTFSSDPDAAPDEAGANLIIMYAAWMWRKRDTGEGVPRMIRWQINNRLFGGELDG